MFLLVVVVSCIEPYLPEVVGPTKDYLVVDGFINSQGVTTIQLTRSIRLADTGQPASEAGATVQIIDDANAHYPLKEGKAGIYQSAYLTLNPARSYQLRISSGRKTYQTDYLTVKTTPPIDNVGWKLGKDGVQIYVSTHDATNHSTYYRWRFEETWQFTSLYNSRYQYNAATKRIERRTDDIYHCWRTTTSNAIVQSNTTRLSQDVVSEFPLTLLASNSEKLPIKYSILVQQQAESKAEYDYWETLKKNTESLGSINDPLPTQLTGNVYAVGAADELVLGFVGIHSVTEKAHLHQPR